MRKVAPTQERGLKHLMTDILIYDPKSLLHRSVD